ncbi:MAG: energy transducer TonB, partial [Flavobacteriaceae bacterium]
MLVYTSCIENTDVKDSSYNIDKEVLKETPLIKKIKDVKHQIEIQGNLSDNEEKGLILLLNIVKGEAFNQELVNEVHNYTSQTSKSELTEMISEVFEQIQIQGNLNEEEDKELKKLLVLTNDDAFDDPYFADIIKFVDIPFGVIEQPPVFPGCEDLSTDEQRDCMAKNISNHVNSNFNIKLADSLKLTGRQRINVIFKIDTEGNIVDVRSRAPHPGLEEEAIRVIKTLPKMIPGEHKGKKVNVPYSLPIIFQVAEDDNNKKVENLEQDILLDIPFAVVEQPPVFPGCKDLSVKEQKDCFSMSITEFVNKNFKTKLANELKLTGRQRINVIFKIDTNGNVEYVKARAPHPGLEEEAIRVIKTLPKMIPGEHKGKKVNVPYSLPIIFQVAEKKVND